MIYFTTDKVRFRLNRVCNGNSSETIRLTHRIIVVLEIQNKFLLRKFELFENIKLVGIELCINNHGYVTIICIVQHSLVPHIRCLNARRKIAPVIFDTEPNSLPTAIM